MNLFRIASLVVLASKLDDLIDKYPTFESDIKELNSNIPQKYLEWSTKQLVSGAKLVDLIPTIKSFDKSTGKFKFQDINRYKSSKELEDEVKELSSKNLLESKTQKSKQISINEAKKLYEDEQYILIRPDTKAAVQKYGKGTKWCITMENEDYYEQYTSQDIVFYFLLDKQDPSKKYAVSVLRDPNDSSDIQGYESYDAEDNRISEMYIPLWDKIESIIQSDIGSVPESLAFKAKNENTSERDLDKLADSESFQIQSNVALNKSTSFRTLDKLSKNKNFHIRADVAHNTNTSIDTLERLSHDKNENVRLEVAKNHNSTKEILILLSKDVDEYVRKHVAIHHNTPSDIVLLLSSDSDDKVRMFAAISNRLPKDVLINMSKDPSANVRQAVADNFNTPLEVLNMLMKDPDKRVSEIASKRFEILNKRR